MRLGIALPVEIPGTSGETLIEWMSRVDDSPFETVAVTDEIVSESFESLTTLAAAAALTRHARLMTVVIAGPTRNTAILAKQAANIDALSGGRLSLGLGVGELVEDFSAVGVDMRRRGKLFEEQLVMLKRIWAGEPMGDSGRPIGPRPVQPGGPELLIGAWAPRAIARVGKYADGYVGGVLSEDMFSDELYRIALESWREHDRPGRPRFVSNVYFVLGTGAEDAFREHFQAAYAGASTEQYDLQAAQAVTPRTERDIRKMVERLESIGVDEAIFHPVVADIDQFDRLEQALG